MTWEQTCVYSGDRPVPFMLPNGLKEILNYNSWKLQSDQKHCFPLLSAVQYADDALVKHPELNFIRLKAAESYPDVLPLLKEDATAVLLLDTDNNHGMAEQRRFFFDLLQQENTVPVIILRKYAHLTHDQLQLYAATDMGGLLIDGLGDGVMLSTELLEGVEKKELKEMIGRNNHLAFGVLQAARTRMSKTEYISCPSCGRTLFDLQETTAMIRKRTDHLKGIKIGIMGCIVNGPGEMADADYGYVGSGKGKITLYRGQEVVKRAVPSAQAVDELIEIIRGDGNWLEAEAID